MVLVEARALGKKKPLVPAWSVPVSPPLSGDGDGGLTLAQLIERIVRAEVRAFEQRRDERRFLRVLSAAQIEAGAARGKVDPGGRPSEDVVDAEVAVANALQAFEDGLYLVLLDGEEQRELQRQVFPTEESHLVFLRLAFLAGG